MSDQESGLPDDSSFPYTTIMELHEAVQEISTYRTGYSLAVALKNIGQDLCDKWPDLSSIIVSEEWVQQQGATRSSGVS